MSVWKMMSVLCLASVAGWAGLTGYKPIRGTEPPADGWANVAPTEVIQSLNRDGEQLLEVRQGKLRTWVRVPDVGARSGDYVLLGHGKLQRGVEVPELDQRVAELVSIRHIRVVDLEAARQAVRASLPENAVAIGDVYAGLHQLAGSQVVVHGTVVKAPHAVGWYWVHLQDGSGDSLEGTHDLTVKTSQAVTVGQRVSFRGRLRQDVNLGFGYHYDALIEQGVLLAE